MQAAPERRLPEEVKKLEIFSLGQMQVRLNGEKLTLSPCAVALLTYLAMNPQQTRREIQLALMADQESGAANSRFKTYLADIRRQLGADAVRVRESTARGIIRCIRALCVRWIFRSCSGRCKKASWPRAIFARCR